MLNLYEMHYIFTKINFFPGGGGGGACSLTPPPPSYGMFHVNPHFT